jgi:hypothetical protein
LRTSALDQIGFLWNSWKKLSRSGLIVQSEWIGLSVNMAGIFGWTPAHYSRRLILCSG